MIAFTRNPRPRGGGVLFGGSQPVQKKPKWGKGQKKWCIVFNPFSTPPCLTQLFLVGSGHSFTKNRPKGNVAIGSATLGLSLAKLGGNMSEILGGGVNSSVEVESIVLLEVIIWGEGLS